MTIAYLKGFGKMPFWRDKLTSFVNEGRRISIHFFTVCVDMDQESKFLKGLS